MDAMFKPENLYSFADSELSRQRVDAFCCQIRDCRSLESVFLLSEKAHWFLCAFWHGAKDDFSYAQSMIESELDFAQHRLTPPD